MKEWLFQGVCTALVTPFLDNEVNFPMLELLIRRQMENGIRAMVLCGTTGEAPTLSDSEKLEIFRRARSTMGSRGILVAGTGSNDTAHAVALSRSAQEAGADMLLVVSPYYNKATPEGLYSHYRAIAQAVSIPVILYNVPSRTGVDIPVKVYGRLSEIGNIVGVKEASQDITKISRILRETELCVFTGNDEHTVPALALGAKGVISVTSNVCPALMQSMARSALDGDFDTAAALNLQLQPLMAALFSEVNPIPVKAAMKCMGYDCGNCRLPLCRMEERNLRRLTEVLSGNLIP